ncbi:Spx/MgsR family RNA polymerase-binding regulatory protein [Pleionea sp. CnH1-48]|uniref:Spx/MgsR family RNA polymerase-binding regulatory protein n=1 Tax=Pleionea sp. CnH1-48 TaxID=2954494 RepID=UPI0020984BE8|nr:Spx/MgsR family RNA polymerase-binding regulatory protein [Pleionea sp. CnH1-48]
MKKALRWLDDNNVEYHFHDYKKEGLSEQQAKTFLEHCDMNLVINKRGTTWRKLDDDIKNNLDEDLAVKLMLDNPSIIKRPLVEFKGNYHLGFKAAEFEAFFANA